MHRKLLLTGDLGVGKSTLIREMIYSYLRSICGFFVQRIYIKNKLVGFSLMPLEEKDDYNLNREIDDIDCAKNVFLYKKNEREWNVNIQVFDLFSQTYMDRLPEKDKKLILMDEIGGVELRSTLFFQAVERLLTEGISVLGVLKSYENVSKMQGKVINETEKETINSSFSRLISNIPLLEVKRMTTENYLEVRYEVRSFVEEVMEDKKR